MTESKDKARQVRHKRVRKKVAGTASRPRLTVFRSLRHISAQIIDDQAGRTIASASTLGKDFAGSGKSRGSVEAAKKIGMAIAEKAKGKNIKDVVFDRGGYKYHGSIKALADAAREQGLNF